MNETRLYMHANIFPLWNVYIEKEQTFTKLESQQFSIFNIVHMDNELN